MAKFGKAPALGAGDCEFESRCPHVTIQQRDKVRHASRTEVGTVTRVFVRDNQKWYQVDWPSGIGSGAIYLERVLTVV